ncbi:MAG: hypothetical protein U0797_29870 [Gemmataceae bacterium]
MKLFKTPADWERSISGEVKLWDARTWREVREVAWPVFRVVPPRRQAAGDRGGAERLVVEVETGRVVTAMAGHTLPVMEAKFTADGSKVISRSYDANRIRATDWDLTTPIMDYADGSKNIAGEVLVWDAVTGKPSGPALGSPRRGRSTSSATPPASVSSPGCSTARSPRGT